MINYGVKTRLELGPIKDNDAYMDVVNIDRYDMIIGTPFMRKHGMILDFKTNTLSIQGMHVTTLGIDATEDVANSAILAAGIHALQNDQHTLMLRGGQQFLQLADFCAQIL